MNKFDEILKELRAKKKVKFDETLECQVAFSLPEKNKSDSIRFSVVFDNSFEKGKKILVLTDGQFGSKAIGFFGSMKHSAEVDFTFPE